MSESTNFSKRAVWNKARIESEKRRIREELHALADANDSQRPLQFCLERIHELAEDLTPPGLLQRFLYILFAFSEHLRHGGLSASQARQSGITAGAILRMAGVRSHASKLAFLYGDLHLMLSQVHWRNGEQWSSAWAQQISLLVSTGVASGGTGMPAFASGSRALRLGHAPLAIDSFRLAESEGLDGPYWARCRLAHIMALRLAGRSEEAQELIANTRKSTALTPEYHLDLAWEQLCLNAQARQDIDELVHAIGPKKSHHGCHYVAEVFLWIRTVKAMDWLKRFPTFRKLARDPSFDTKSLGPLHACLRTFEFCYDQENPYPVRLEHLGKTLSQLGLFASVDKELMVLASAVRWLARSRSNNHTLALLQSQYQALCFRLSEGKAKDTLNLLGDVHRPLTKEGQEILAPTG